MQVAHGLFNARQLIHIVDFVGGFGMSGIIIEELDMLKNFGGQRNNIHGVERFKTIGAVKEERVLVGAGNIFLKGNVPQIYSGATLAS